MAVPSGSRWFIAVAARRDGQHAGPVAAGLANDGRRVNRAAGEILAPVNDAGGMVQIVDVIVFAGAKIINIGHETGRIAQRSFGPAGSQNREKKGRGGLQDAFGAFTFNVQNGFRLRTQGLDLFSAQIQGRIPGDALPGSD